MSTTFVEAPPPYATLRWPDQLAIGLSQFGDQVDFSDAQLTPNFPLASLSQGGNNFPGTTLELVASVPMMRSISSGVGWTVPWGPCPVSEATRLSREFPDLPTVVVRFMLVHTPGVSRSEGFGFGLSNNTSTPLGNWPAAATGKGGLVVRLDSTLNTVRVESYIAGGVQGLTFDTPPANAGCWGVLRFNRPAPFGPSPLPSVDVEIHGEAGGGVNPFTFTRRIEYNGLDLPQLGVGVPGTVNQWTTLMQQSAGALVATRGAVAAYFPPIR